MPSVAENIEELFPLFAFCKAGHLCDMAERIAENKPIDPPFWKKDPAGKPLQKQAFALHFRKSWPFLEFFMTFALS